MAGPRRLAWIGAGVVAAAAVVAAIALREPPLAEAPGAGSGPPVSVAPRGGSGVASGSGVGSAGSAAQLVASARAAAAAGDLGRAHALLARAYALDPAPDVLLDLAAAERDTGHCREARRATQRAIDEAPPELAERGRRLLAEIGRCD